MGQPIVLGEIKAEILCRMKSLHIIKFYGNSTWNELNHFHQKAKWVDSVRKQDLCVFVEVEQYFMTKDTGDCRPFRSVACREYTLHRDDPASQPKGWIQGNMRIGPVLEVTTSFQHGKHGIEIRIWSVAQDNSQSWVRISYGTNKYVIDSNHNNTEISADPHEDQKSQTSVKVIAARSKAKAKPRKRELLTHQVSYRCTKESGLTLSHQNHLSLHTKSRRKWSVFFDTIKRYSGKRMEQFNSGELNFIFEINSHKYSIGLMIVGKLVWQQEEVQKGDISIALKIREESFTSVLFRHTLGIISLILRYRTM